MNLAVPQGSRGRPSPPTQMAGLVRAPKYVLPIASRRSSRIGDFREERANLAVVPLLAIARTLYATSYINALALTSPWIYRLAARRAGERLAGTDPTAS